MGLTRLCISLPYHAGFRRSRLEAHLRMLEVALGAAEEVVQVLPLGCRNKNGRPRIKAMTRAEDMKEWIKRNVDWDNYVTILSSSPASSNQPKLWVAI
jgi:hypothetical protein